MDTRVAAMTGCLEELGANFYPASIGTENGDAQLWSFQAEGQQKKPCSKRSGKNDPEDPWIPSYSSKITHHFSPESLLQPQSLKNEDLIEPNPASNADLAVPERRSYSSAHFSPPQEDEKGDCGVEPVSPKERSSVPVDPAAIKLIKSCLKRTQLSSSRRSLSDPDFSDSDEMLSSNEKESDTELSFRKGGNSGIAPEIRSKDTIFNPRICYACSTATNPSCWEPNRRTTVKYCAKEKSCVTKSFGNENAMTLIRDCADSCEGSSLPGIEPKYKKCKICDSDLCNGAFSVNAYNVAIILAISIVKYTF